MLKAASQNNSCNKASIQFPYNSTEEMSAVRNVGHSHCQHRKISDYISCFYKNFMERLKLDFRPIYRIIMRNSYHYVCIMPASVGLKMKSRIIFTRDSSFKMSRETHLEGKRTMGDTDKNDIHEK